MYKVFPCGENKTPLIKNWQQLATTDQSQIQMWQQLYNGKLRYWGVPTGAVNGILVLDIDCKPGKANGFETIKTLALETPVTHSQRTISGGAHLIYAYPNDGKKYGNRANLRGNKENPSGLDIRGEGGYIIWYGGDQTPIAQAPRWVLEDVGRQEIIHPVQSNMVVDPQVAEGIIKASLDAIVNAPEGESNNVLNTESFKIGQLIASHVISREYAVQVLYEAAIKRGKPHHEAVATINSGLDGGSQKPLSVPFGAPDLTGIPEPPQPKRFTPDRMSRHDLFNVKKLRKPQLFKTWSTEDIHLTIADGGTGKTTMKLYEAVCLALGERFLGFECLQPGAKTLFITGEDSAEKLKAMVGSILKAMDKSHDEAAVERVLDCIYIKKADFTIVVKDRQGFYHASDAAYDQVSEAVRETGAKMVVFDPIASFWGSEQGLNDMAKAVSKFMSRLVDEHGVCAEMINHMGKASSSGQDITQFAGRGGTGLPSHSRVVRVLRYVSDQEYNEMTDDTLDDGETAMLCNVNKFSDSSPLLNDPFIIIRTGWLFNRQPLTPAKKKEEQDKIADTERVYSYVKEQRATGQYPTKSLLTARFASGADKISEKRVKNAINLLVYEGNKEGYRIKFIQHPDATVKEAGIVIVDDQGMEV